MRLGYSSDLPIILRSDPTADKGIQRVIQAVNWLTPVLGLCVAISAVVAPLGLSNTISQTINTIQKPAIYIADDGHFGRTTPPRQPTTFTRDCSHQAGQICPGWQTVMDVVRNSTGIYSNSSFTDTHISPHTRELYESGLQDLAPTVSGAFDIRARLYVKKSEDHINHGGIQPVSRFRKIQTVFQQDSNQLVERRVIDTKVGVGFSLLQLVFATVIRFL